MKSVEAELIKRVLCPSAILPANKRQLLGFFFPDSDLFGQICRGFCSVLVNDYIFIVLTFYLHYSDFLIALNNHYTYQKTLKKYLHGLEARKEKFLSILANITDLNFSCSIKSI